MRILLGDAAWVVRETIARRLKELGHEVTTVDSVGSLLQRFTSGPYDVVVTDINLPTNNGPELLHCFEADIRLGQQPFVICAPEAVQERVEKLKGVWISSLDLRNLVAALEQLKVPV